MNGNEKVFTWPEDPQVEVRVDVEKGVIDAPVRVRCGDAAFAFGGFWLNLGGQGPEGWRVEEVVHSEKDGEVILGHRLAHAGLSQPVEVTVGVRADETPGAIRFRIETAEAGLHLDGVGVRDHVGDGVEARRVFLGKQFVMDAPIEPFDTSWSRNNFSSSLTRFWAVQMANGVTEAQAIDVPQQSIVFDGDAGRYDLRTYCSSPITYTLIFSTETQETLSRLRRAVAPPKRRTTHQIAGRPAVMTWHPAPEYLRGLVEEFRRRGVRDVFWFAYSPTEGAAEYLEREIGALYTPYECYVCYFDAVSDGGKRACKQWRAEDCEYRQDGSLRRGYHQCTHLLPERYVEYATMREMVLYCLGDRDEIVLPTASSHISNLKQLKELCHPKAVYMDVHSSTRPQHYFDHEGKHHSVREFIDHTTELFDFARDYLGDAVIFSESGGEWLVGPMDGGCFHDELHSDLTKCQIQAANWEVYPFLEQVHREHHLSIGFDRKEVEPGWQSPGSEYRRHLSHLVLTGRPALLTCYQGSDLTKLDDRTFDYYLTSGLSRVLGLSPIERVDFDGGDIHRQVVHYGNGMVVRVNRGQEVWEVEGYRLPRYGFLATGPDFFQVHDVTEEGEPVDVVECPEYRFYACPKHHDFGPLALAGAVAVREQGPGEVVLHEAAKLRGVVEADLPRLFGRPVRFERLTAGLLFGQEIDRALSALVRLKGDRLRFDAMPDPTVRYHVLKVGQV